ncbi:MAG: glutathione peroxidase [Chitinophagaceae bacterium]|nr:glutathione peroxidase [Chitinophagaceae bacterium]
MTVRQKILKAIYPAWMWYAKLRGTNITQLSNGKKHPPVPFYSLKGALNNNTELDFSTFKGRKVLLVNTASNCGYTDQYNQLQKLYEENKDNLVILGFPANDFKEQEKGTDEEIAQFCKLNYGVTFPLMKKSTVIRGDGQNEVFKWLTDSSRNGWNNKQPSWNFAKYLVNESGMLTNYFGSSVSPLDKEVIAAIKK